MSNSTESIKLRANEVEKSVFITFASYENDLNTLNFVFNELRQAAYIETERKLIDGYDSGVFVNFKSTTHSLNSKNGCFRVIVNGIGRWKVDPFLGDWDHEEISSESGTPSDLAPPPLVFRLDPSEVPDFLIPAIVPEGSSLKSCRVIDAFKAPDSAADALLRKLGISAPDLKVEVAEALLVQARWSIGLFFRLAKKGRRTSIKSLLQVDPKLDVRVAALLTAVVNRNADALRQVLRSNANGNLENVRLPGGNSLLHFTACVPGSIAVASELLDQGANINVRSDVGTGPLLSAIWADAQLADFLLDHGADPLTVGLEGDTALNAAAWLGRHDLTARLLDAVASPFITDKNSGHALVWAAQAGHADIIDLILERFPLQIDVPTGAYGLGSDDTEFEPDAVGLPAIARFRRRRIVKDHSLGRSALMAATLAGRVKAVELLLVRGANANFADRHDRTALHYATLAEAPKPSIIKMLIKGGANLEAKDEDGHTPLMVAALSEQSDILLFLAGLGAKINAKDKKGQTTLHHAAAFGRLTIVRQLLKLKPDIALQDAGGFTPLHLALSFPDASAEVVEALIECGSDPNELTSDGRTPLMLLLSSERTPAQRVHLAKVLLHLRADPHLSSPSGRSALFLEAYKGNNDIVDLLLSTNTIPLRIDKPQATPLHVAVIRGHDGVVASLISALLKVGAGVDQIDKAGETALHEAVRHRNRNAWLMLLEAGSDPWLANYNGRTPALDAALNGLEEFLDPVFAALDLENVKDRVAGYALTCASALGRIGVVRRLLQHGALIDTRTPDNWRPLSVAALRGQLEITDLLLERGARVNWRSDVPTALSCAAENGNEEIVRKLVAATADPNAPASGGTPLCFAAAHDHLGAVRLLLDGGAFPDTRDRLGKTPLHIAAEKGNFEIVRALLQAKANPEALDNKGQSPLFLAVGGGNEASVELLLAAGADVKLRDSDGRSVIEVAIGKSVIDRLVKAGEHPPSVRPPESSRAEFLKWEPVSQSRAGRLREQLNKFAMTLDDDTLEKWLKTNGQSILLEARLSFYNHAFIVAIPDDGTLAPNEKFLIWSEPNSFFRMLDWTNEPIFTANENLHWRINGGDQLAATQYLKFFFFFVRGQLGRFEIAEPEYQLNWLDNVSSEQKIRVSSNFRAVEILPDPPEGTLQFRFTCVFKNAIFLTDAYLGLRSTSFINDGETVALAPGQFQLANEKLLEEDLAIRVAGPPTKFG